MWRHCREVAEEAIYCNMCHVARNYCRLLSVLLSFRPIYLVLSIDIGLLELCHQSVYYYYYFYFLDPQ